MDRRQVSGRRVLCRCSMELPKLDPFSSWRARCAGFMVLNVRGGSLYLAHPFNEAAAERAFPSGKALPIKSFTLFPDDGEPMVVGSMQMRYLKLAEGKQLSALVLRFVGLNETQLDLLNTLETRCPIVEGDEEASIPVERLHRLG